MKTAKNGERKRRAAPGDGRLYKRGVNGKEFPPDSPANHPFWLAYSVGGERVRQPLKDSDGNPITNRDAAEAERKRIIAPFKARDEAEAQRQILARLGAAETAVIKADDEATPPLKIVEAKQAYLDSDRRKDSGPVTLEGYLSQWARFEKWATAQNIVYMRDLTREQVKAYVADMNADKFSASTFNQHVGTLTRFWKVLTDEARTSVNLWGDVQSKTIDRIERRKRALTMAEASAVIEKAEPGDMLDLLTLIACTGQRWGDICTLKWSSVDLTAGVITLVPAKTRRRKGESVFIPILPQARAVLESRKKTDKHVFPLLCAEYKRDNSVISKRIQATFAKANIETQRKEGDERAICEVGGHSMRHTFNTVARWAGLPDALIQKITGHSSARMTDHYSQFDRALVSKLAKSFESLPTGTGTLALPPVIETAPTREPLPPWAGELLEKMDSKNWEKIKAEMQKEVK